MISRLRGICDGGIVSVVGSSPTATMLYGCKSPGITIAVNGATNLEYEFHYFMCGDIESPLKDWFHRANSTVRIIAAMIATVDQMLYPESLYPDMTRHRYPYHHRKKLGQLPDPIHPHLYFEYRFWNVDRISRDMDSLMFGGSISCCALQLAFVMGASTINLFGCSFSHSGGSYFYSDPHPGEVPLHKVSVMQSTINRIRRHNVTINIVGDSLLV